MKLQNKMENQQKGLTGVKKCGRRLSEVEGPRKNNICCPDSSGEDSGRQHREVSSVWDVPVSMGCSQ